MMVCDTHENEKQSKKWEVLCHCWKSFLTVNKHSEHPGDADWCHCRRLASREFLYQLLSWRMLHFTLRSSRVEVTESQVLKRRCICTLSGEPMKQALTARCIYLSIKIIFRFEHECKTSERSCCRIGTVASLQLTYNCSKASIICNFCRQVPAILKFLGCFWLFVCSNWVSFRQQWFLWCPTVVEYLFGGCTFLLGMLYQRTKCVQHCVVTPRWLLVSKSWLRSAHMGLVVHMHSYTALAPCWLPW